MIARQVSSLPLLAMLSLAAGCQNSSGEEGATPPAGNAAALNASSPPAGRAAAPPPETPPPSGSADPSPAVDNSTPPAPPTPASAPAEPAPAAAGPYLAVARSGSAIPDALGAGRFTVRDDCVVYRPDGSSDVFTPVFPAGTRLVPNGLSVGGRRVEFGRSYRVSGGEVPASGARLASPAPDRCPARRFVLGRVSASP